ncbi:DUF4239 domain-containing protein [Pseudonocardiaceae bacterium YIM PH 21723]|nr:DUF4239 domain-containing protein [Pseudonocardiaceae bacterium YIM PH 21723]
MFTWIYDLPTWLMFLMFTGVSLIISWGGVLLLRPALAKIFHGEEKDTRNGLLELVLTGTGLFYGLLLGLVAAGCYTTYSQSCDLVNKEASAAASVYRDVTAYPEPLRGQLRGQVETYVHTVVDSEWPLQQAGDPIPRDKNRWATLIQARLAAYEPQTEGQKILHRQTLEDAKEFYQARRARLDAVDTGLPGALWWVILLGALINLILISMLSVNRLMAHLLISGLFAVFIAMMIFLIAAMDHPFLGEFSVDPEAFESLIVNVLGRN